MSTIAAWEERPAGLLARLSDYVELTKPRIAVLVLVTVAVSGYVARYGQPDPWLLLHAMLGTAWIAASASALNHWLERRSDALMERTASRPLPAGRLGSREVLVFAGIMLTLGIAWLWSTTGWAPALWGVVTWVVYVCIYTPLKRRTGWNTAIGAISGATPVWIGWTAVGGVLDLRAAALFLVLFLWQFPHFMAIAWLYRGQYRLAGMRMMSVIDPSGRRAGVQAVLGAAALLPVSVVFGLPHPGPGCLVHAGVSLLLGVALLAGATLFLARRDDRSARWLLRLSLVYLPALLALLMLVPLV